jgi:hypothetical protein
MTRLAEDAGRPVAGCVRGGAVTRGMAVAVGRIIANRSRGLRRLALLRSVHAAAHCGAHLAGEAAAAAAGASAADTPSCAVAAAPPLAACRRTQPCHACCTRTLAQPPCSGGSVPPIRAAQAVHADGCDAASS